MHSRIQAAAMLVLALAAAHHPARAQTAQPRPASEVRLSVEPVLSIGRLDGPEEYLLAGINAGAVLADGSVVVSDRQHFRVQRFSSEGDHLWSSGRAGEGPGEFEYVQVGRGGRPARGTLPGPPVAGLRGIGQHGHHDAS